MEAIEQNALQNPDKILEVQISLQDGDYVAVFSRVRQKPGDLGGAVVHIFRFLGDRIIELLDIGQAVPENSVNERLKLTARRALLERPQLSRSVRRHP